MIVRRALLRETLPRSVSHRCAATMTRTAPRFVFLEGGAATGKTSVCEELAARQYTVRFENFVELCAANTRYEPSGSVMVRSRSLREADPPLHTDASTRAHRASNGLLKCSNFSNTTRTHGEYSALSRSVVRRSLRKRGSMRICHAHRRCKALPASKSAETIWFLLIDRF